MKIQLLSDLHNEFCRPKLPSAIANTGADAVVLAGDIDVGLQGLRWAGHERLYFLENDEVVMDGVRFLGCTLWTDYKAVGDQVLSMIEVQLNLSDHYVISNGVRNFLTEDALALHIGSRSWLEERLHKPFDGKTVVVTHHAPHPVCQHPAFPMDAMATAFLSDLDELIDMADLWCFGHTHSNLDKVAGKCRLISNQRGYPNEGVAGFDSAAVVDI